MHHTQRGQAASSVGERAAPSDDEQGRGWTGSQRRARRAVRGRGFGGESQVTLSGPGHSPPTSGRPGCVPRTRSFFGSPRGLPTGPFCRHPLIGGLQPSVGELSNPRLAVSCLVLRGVPFPQAGPPVPASGVSCSSPTSSLPPPQFGGVSHGFLCARVQSVRMTPTLPSVSALVLPFHSEKQCCPSLLVTSGHPSLKGKTHRDPWDTLVALCPHPTRST